jgi:hypothetical protein
MKRTSSFFFTSSSTAIAIIEQQECCLGKGLTGNLFRVDCLYAA